MEGGNLHKELELLSLACFLNITTKILNKILAKRGGYSSPKAQPWVSC
jgi:hypothetical protein